MLHMSHCSLHGSKHALSVCTAVWLLSGSQCYQMCYFGLHVRCPVQEQAGTLERKGTVSPPQVAYLPRECFASIM